jgi:ribosomal protein L37E
LNKKKGGRRRYFVSKAYCVSEGINDGISFCNTLQSYLKLYGESNEDLFLNKKKGGRRSYFVFKAYCGFLRVSTMKFLFAIHFKVV